MAKEYIDREALLKDLAELYDKSDPRWQRGRDIRQEMIVSRKIIENHPTADVQEVRQGEWCHIGGDEWCCSWCGGVISTEGSWEKPTKKYCSECGAKMDKE